MAPYLFSLLLFCYSAIALVVIPAPTGQYAVGQTTAKLIDESRVDPYDPNHGKRNIMTSLYYPIERRACQQNCTVDYMPPTTADLFGVLATQLGVPNGTFQQIRLQVCCKHTASARGGAKKKFPVVLFSPGLGSSRLIYGALAQTLASAGYAVVTMDHTYETSIVEYPDGTYTPGLNSTYWFDDYPNRFVNLLYVRVQDARHILDRLSDGSLAKQLLPDGSCSFDPHKVAMYGHSFGGATAFLGLSEDPRFLGGLVLDGALYGNISTIEQPAVFFGRSDPNPHNRTDDTTWSENWEHLKGWRSEISLRESAHNTFTDAPLWAKLFGIPMEGLIKEQLGTLDGERAFTVITTYVQAFMDFVLKGKKTTLFDEQSAKYPEIVVSED